jgi:hypothetical protein
MLGFSVRTSAPSLRSSLRHLRGLFSRRPPSTARHRRAALHGCGRPTCSAKDASADEDDEGESDKIARLEQRNGTIILPASLPLMPDAERVWVVLAVAIADHVGDPWPEGEPTATPEWLAENVDGVLAVVERLYAVAAVAIILARANFSTAWRGCRRCWPTSPSRDASTLRIARVWCGECWR